MPEQLEVEEQAVPQNYRKAARIPAPQRLAAQRKRTLVHSAEADSAVLELLEVEEQAVLQNYRKAARIPVQQRLAVVRAEGSPRKCPQRSTSPYPAFYGRLQSDCPT